MTPIDDYTEEKEREAFAKGQAEALAKEPLTMEDIRNMSVKEIVANKREVDEVMRAHKVEKKAR